MKKLFILMAAALISVCGCAQKKAVNTAKNKAMSSENPDFVGAREAIKGALVDPETKDQANTWFVAGLIGYKEIEYAELQRMLGQTFDDKKAGENAYESYKYWLVADSLSQVMVADKKGNLKPADPKTRKAIQEKMVEYYTKNFILSLAFEKNSQKQMDEAYELTLAHLNIPDLPMMKDDAKLQAKMLRDTTYYTYKYYAGRFAYEAKRYDEATKIFTEICTTDLSKALTSDAIYSMEFLCEIKKELKDSVGYLNQLKLGFETFPQEPWFVQNLINYYLQDLNDEKGAIEYIDQAIAADPQLQYFNLKGELYIRSNRFDDAEKIFKELIAKDATYAPAYDGLGRTYYFKAYTAEEDAQNISDNKKYQIALDAAKKMYEPALEPLKKAAELDDKNRNALILLKNAYYKLGRYDESKAVADQLNN